ncbi:MAG TPA: LuxR family transcriptional regulator [Actinobacteria bacterium]|nr:LuxR family transcriptional regulator [Actinomycetota bacterium]
MAQMTGLAALGALVRTAPRVPPVLMICDQQAALIPLEPAGPGTGAVHVREPAIVAALAATFASTWQAATPLAGTHPPAGPADLTASERALLRLLAGGLTDDAAARRLGVSARTVRRQVAVLMAKLGAASRFQAGRKAAERGWL